MSNIDQNIKTLIDLGLTGTQAKTYLALLLTGPTSIKEIAIASGVARPDTYRAILELEETGIVEKIISIPTKFRTLPVNDAVDILISRKIKENADLNARAIKLIERVKEKTNSRPPLESDKLVLIPRDAIELELRKHFENSRENFCAMVSNKRLFLWATENFAIIKDALKRKVTVRVVTEDCPKSNEPKELEELKKSQFFEVRYNVGQLIAWFRIYDHKEVVLSTSLKSEEPMHSAVWSNNHTLVELAQDYFDAAWFSAIEPNHQPFKRDRRQFDYLFTNMTDGFSYNKIILDGCGKLVDFELLETNQAFEKITGVGKTVLGKKASEVFPEMTKELSDLLDIHGKAVLTGKSVKFEHYFKRNDKWLSVLVYSPNKGYFVSIFEDITDQKKERDLLKESEEKYKHFTKYAPVAIYEIDCNTLQLKCVNDCMCELTGYSEKELLSMSPFDLLDFESQEHFKEIMRKSFAGEKIDETVEFRIIKKDGSKRWANLNAKLIYNKNKLYKAFVVAHDVTERKECEEALIKKIPPKE